MAGLALLPTLAAALAGALSEAEHRFPAVAIFVVATGGATVLWIAPAFWALVVGLAAWWAVGAGRKTARRRGAASDGGITTKTDLGTTNR